jgi:Na+/proline symporter
MGSNLDLIIVGVYLAVLVLIGVAFSRLVKNGSDYFRAGGRGSWWLVGSSMFMAGISAYTFVGNAAGIYESGWSPLSIYLANIAGFILASLVLAGWYRQMRAVTFAEILRERFGRTAEQIVAHLLVFNGFIWAGVGLYTLAVFVNPLVPGMNVQAVIVIVGAIVVLYCTIGGNWAVMANDFVQGLIMIAAITVVTFLCLFKAGGFHGFFSAIAQSDAATQLQFIKPTSAGETIWSAKHGIAWVVVSFVIQFANQSSLFQGVRYFSAKDGREAKRASMLACAMMLLGCLTFFVPPIYARLFLSPEVMASNINPAKAAEFAYSIASRQVLPIGTFSIMIVAIFAAAISTLDVGLNRNAALVIRDLLPPIRRLFKLGAMPADREVFYGKAATIGSGVVVIGVAMIYTLAKSTSIFDLAMDIAGRLIFPQMIPLLLFLFIRKVPRWSILSSILGGFIPSIIELSLGLTFSYQLMGTLVLIGGVAGYLISCLFWNRVSQQEKDETAAFYKKMTTKIDFAGEVGEDNDAYQLSLLGRFSVMIGGLLLLMCIPVKSFDGRMVILAVAGFISGVGLLMVLAGRRIIRRKKAEKKMSRH